MRVAEPFVFDETRQPIVLLNENEKTAAGTASTITGWGVTGSGEILNILQTVNIPIITKSECSKLYSMFGALPEGQICVIYLCQGDSGGPLAVDGRLAGVVSWGNSCAVAGNPGAYTEVAAYRAWIKQQTIV